MARTWTDRIAATYLITVALLILLQRHKVEHALAIVGTHVLLAATVFATYGWVLRKHPTPPEGDTS